MIMRKRKKIGKFESNKKKLLSNQNLKNLVSKRLIMVAVINTINLNW